MFSCSLDAAWNARSIIRSTHRRETFTTICPSNTDGEIVNHQGTTKSSRKNRCLFSSDATSPPSFFRSRIIRRHFVKRTVSSVTREEQKHENRAISRCYNPESDTTPWISLSRTSFSRNFETANFVTALKLKKMKRVLRCEMFNNDFFERKQCFDEKDQNDVKGNQNLRDSEHDRFWKRSHFSVFPRCVALIDWRGSLILIERGKRAIRIIFRLDVVFNKLLLSVSLPADLSLSLSLSLSLLVNPVKAVPFGG